MVPDHIVSTAGFIMTISGLIALVAIVAIWAWSATRNQNGRSQTTPQPIQKHDESGYPRPSDLIIEIRISDDRGADPSRR